MEKQKIGLQCYQTIAQRIIIIHYNRIEKHEYSSVYKDFNEVSPSDDWFP